MLVFAVNCSGAPHPSCVQQAQPPCATLRRAATAASAAHLETPGAHAKRPRAPPRTAMASRAHQATATAAAAIPTGRL